MQAHSYHKGDVNALAAAPGHNRVFSAGSDGQVLHFYSQKKSCLKYSVSVLEFRTFMVGS